MAKLTGRWQFRIQERFLREPLVVLQLEVEQGYGPDDSDGMPMWLPGTFWRDAKPQDLINGELHHLEGLVPK